jgi:hypothetical protein
MKKIPYPDRFWSKVNKTDGCWEWIAGRNKDGYGQIGKTHGDAVGAHRVAYELMVGPIPEGMCVLHRCDNPGCVNPDHLFLGTRADNTADMKAKGRARGPSFYGASNANAKLTEQDVREIRFIGGSGISQRALGLLYGVGQTQVGRILRGTRWASSP